MRRLRSTPHLVLSCASNLRRTFLYDADHGSDKLLRDWLSGGALAEINATNIDLPPFINEGRNKPRAWFHDEAARRCRICMMPTPDYTAHTASPYHHARAGLLDYFLLKHYGTTHSMWRIVSRWWPNIRDDARFFRIKELSCETQEGRRRRLHHVLRFLYHNGVLKHAFCVLAYQGSKEMIATRRSTEFDKMEWVGDNVMKRHFYERLWSALSFEEYTHKLQFVLSFMQGNEPLQDAYDYLEVESIICEGWTIKNRDGLPVSKMKSDVMEALVGELQTYYWSTQSTSMPETSVYASLEDVPLRLLVLHTLHELVTMMFLRAMYSVAEYAIPFLERYCLIRGPAPGGLFGRRERVPQAGAGGGGFLTTFPKHVDGTIRTYSFRRPAPAPGLFLKIQEPIFIGVGKKAVAAHKARAGRLVPEEMRTIRRFPPPEYKHYLNRHTPASSPTLRVVRPSLTPDALLRTHAWLPLAAAPNGKPDDRLGDDDDDDTPFATVPCHPPHFTLAVSKALDRKAVRDTSRSNFTVV
eukprot:PhM_4_TR3765/c0_g1_i2/m.41975